VCHQRSDPDARLFQVRAVSAVDEVEQAAVAVAGGTPQEVKDS
jgi:hypothetical protein